MPKNIKKILRELKTGQRQIYGEQLQSVILYGSYARGDAHPPDSDIDVMIVLKDYQNYGKEIDRTGELVSVLSLEYGISISRVIMNESQWKDSDTPLLRNIRAEGLPA